VTERLPTVTARQLIRVLERHGWELHRTRGSHQHFVHPDRAAIVTVPVHAKDLKRGLVAGILKDAGISREEFLRTL
jgi:predicted RNA binding protein YcfA (HicA-like mRNA interferase family)